MKDTTYRIVHFLIANRYVGIAWNYDQAILVSTRDHATYTDARAELGERVAEVGARLRWFDGEYDCKGDGDQMLVGCAHCDAKSSEHDARCPGRNA